MFSYFMVSPKEAATLMTPYSNPMAFYSHWFINKNVQKQFQKSLYIDVDLQHLNLHTNMFYGPMSGVQFSYSIIVIAY